MSEVNQRKKLDREARIYHTDDRTHLDRLPADKEQYDRVRTSFGRDAVRLPVDCWLLPEHLHQTFRYGDELGYVGISLDGGDHLRRRISSQSQMVGLAKESPQSQ